jgi:hypothetical protein
MWSLRETKFSFLCHGLKTVVRIIFKRDRAVGMIGAGIAFEEECSMFKVTFLVFHDRI